MRQRAAFSLPVELYVFKNCAHVNEVVFSLAACHPIMPRLILMQYVSHECYLPNHAMRIILTCIWQWDGLCLIWIQIILLSGHVYNLCSCLCWQILHDAALLKCQRKEIKELWAKLLVRWTKYSNFNYSSSSEVWKYFYFSFKHLEEEILSLYNTLQHV